jgi:hypothetical protein
MHASSTCHLATGACMVIDTFFEQQGQAHLRSGALASSA